MEMRQIALPRAVICYGNKKAWSPKFFLDNRYRWLLPEDKAVYKYILVRFRELHVRNGGERVIFVELFL